MARARKPKSLVEEDQIRGHLSDLDIHKSIGTDGMYLQVLGDLADVIVRPFSILFARS